VSWVRSPHGLLGLGASAHSSPPLPETKKRGTACSRPVRDRASPMSRTTHRSWASPARLPPNHASDLPEGPGSLSALRTAIPTRLPPKAGRMPIGPKLVSGGFRWKKDRTDTLAANPHVEQSQHGFEETPHRPPTGSVPLRVRRGQARATVSPGRPFRSWRGAAWARGKRSGRAAMLRQ
jgi:hypothetical protein